MQTNIFAWRGAKTALAMFVKRFCFPSKGNLCSRSSAGRRGCSKSEFSNVLPARAGYAYRDRMARMARILRGVHRADVMTL
jgi:hypothetical protein